MIGWLIFAVVMLVAVCWLITQIGRTVAALRGHSRCVACRSRLKAVGAAYATTCAKCARTQPWAAARTATRQI